MYVPTSMGRTVIVGVDGTSFHLFVAESCKSCTTWITLSRRPMHADGSEMRPARPRRRAGFRRVRPLRTSPRSKCLRAADERYDAAARETPEIIG